MGLHCCTTSQAAVGTTALWAACSLQLFLFFTRFLSCLSAAPQLEPLHACLLQDIQEARAGQIYHQKSLRRPVGFGSSTAGHSAGGRVNTNRLRSNEEVRLDSLGVHI